MVDPKSLSNEEALQTGRHQSYPDERLCINADEVDRMADIVDSAIGDMEKEFGFASGSHSVIYSNARNDINHMEIKA